MKKTVLGSILFGTALLLQSAQPILPAIPQGKAARVQKTTTGKTQLFAPQINGNIITFGNKKLELLKDGKIKVSADGILIAEILAYYSVDNLKTKQTDWSSFEAAVSTLKRDGNKFVWVLNKKYKGNVWKAADQILTILPDNRLKFETKMYKPESPDLKMRGDRGSQWIVLPLATVDGAKCSFSGKTYTVSSRGKKYAFGDSTRINNLDSVYYLGNPAYEFAVAVPTSSCCWCGGTVYPSVKNVRYAFSMKDCWNGTLIFDFRKGIATSVSPDTRGGVNFQAVEKLELPDSTRRNLLPNPSFERGLEGYHIWHNLGLEFPEKDFKKRWAWKPFELQSKVKRSGKYALEMVALKDKSFWGDDYRRLRCTVNMTTHAVVLDPGTYTCSFYAIGEPGCKTTLNTWVPNFHEGSAYTTKDTNMIGQFPLSSTEWKRCTMTFTIKRGRPIEIHFNVSSQDKKSCKVWVDDIQLEKGAKATAFQLPPAEGRLLTSEPENFVSASQQVNGRLQIHTDIPNVSGKVRVQVKNFFAEKLLDQEFSFKTDARGEGIVSLPLDTLPGLGLFTVRADYTLPGGVKAFDHHRYARIKYLNNTHRLKYTFAADYGSPELSWNFYAKLNRWRKLGVGSKQHHHTFNPLIMQEERKYGIEPQCCFMLSYFREYGHGGCTGFCILDDDHTESYRKPNDPRILIRDFHYDSNGKITPEYQKKLQKAVAHLVRKYPEVPMWAFGGEFIAHFSKDWWGKNLSDRDLAHMHALLLQAFVAGVKEANPKAKVFQDDPCNMRPDGGIAETDLLLQECNKLGVHFDVIAIHPYRFSPEAPDMDSDAALLFSVLQKNGYGDVQVIWPEGMHWGPFTIPQWGVDSSTWGGIPRTWTNSLLSYDIGWTEKKSASWYARAWLVALKYNIHGATAGMMGNNFAMDVMMTPYAAQLIPNTLGNIFGDCVFKTDIRFAPFIRTFIFEDAQKRPVAAVWCHLDKVDDGLIDAPVAEADFGNTLESVIDLMNSPRAFKPGKVKFAVSGFPLFFRGKPGTLKQMINAFQNAQMLSGEGVSPVELVVRPANKTQAAVSLKNFLSAPFNGTLNGKKITIPGAGQSVVSLPLPVNMAENELVRENFNISLKRDTGAVFEYKQSFDTFEVKRLPDNLTINTVNWNSLPAKKLFQTDGTKTTGDFRFGWNNSGYFIQIQVKDSKFVHVEYPDTASRWNNDCVQMYIDTMANARVKGVGYDENDYEYAIFPNSKGNASIVYRARSVEQQLGLGTQAPADKTIARDIPSTFSNKDGVLTYRIFIPAKYLLPLRMQSGVAFGFGLYVPDSVAPKKLAGGLTLAQDKKGCYNRPHLWPLAVMTE